MGILRLICFILLLFILTIFPLPVFANHESPAVFVRGVVDQYLDILKSEKDKSVQKDKVLDLIKSSFDFPDMAETMLRGLEVKDSEKSAFIDLFPMLLQMRYNIFIKLPGSLVVEFSRYEVYDSETKAIVYTRTKISPHDFALNYKLHHVDGKWKIQDITVDSISLIGNYRAQIHKIITRISFSDFLSNLEKMVKSKTSS